MTTPENPFSHPDNFDFYDTPQAHDSEALDMLLLDKFKNLNQSLETQRPADFKTREFHFYDDSILESAALPSSVTSIINNGNRLLELTVACAHAHDTDPTTVSHEFVFGFTNNEERTELGILRPHYYTYTAGDTDVAEISNRDDDEEDEVDDYDDNPDTERVRDTKEVEAATPEELNKLMASLMFCSDTENIPPAFNYRDCDLPLLTNALRPVADGTTGKNTYALTDKNGELVGEFSSYIHGDVPVAFQVIQTRFSTTPSKHRSAFDELEINISGYNDGDDITTLFRHRLTSKDFSTSTLDYNSINLKTLFAFIDAQTKQ